MKSRFIAAVLLVAGVGFWGYNIVQKQERAENLSASAPSTPRTDFRVLVIDPLHAQSLAAEILRQSATPAPVKSRMKKAHRGVHATFVDPSFYEDAAGPVAPAARLALRFVGADEAATEIWSAAINDPSLPPTERQDLIEDLNEDGFPDPLHITVDDLPLIYSRLVLIENLAPESMDDVNAAAFAEAYKDLVNMVDLLAQQ